MKIALINENSQAAKNALIEATLRKVVEPMGHEVVNYGMYAADDAAQLTYVQNGILAAVLLNSGAADMTARPQLTWLDLEDTEEKIWKDMMETTHFRLPVGSGSLDDFKGLADLSEVLMDQHLYPDKPLKASLIEKVRQPLFIPETLILTKLLRFFRTKGVHEAVVIDEYGTLSGLITLHDVLEEIVGDMPGDKQDIIDEKNKFIRRSENSWLVEGLCSIDEFREYFHIEEELPGEAEDYYKTLGGFITYLLGYIPKETEKATYDRFTFEVMDCDNRRVDKVLVTEGTPSEKEQKENGKKN